MLQGKRSQNPNVYFSEEKLRNGQIDLSLAVGSKIPPIACQPLHPMTMQPAMDGCL
jgi:hypothetical protein